MRDQFSYIADRIDIRLTDDSSTIDIMRYLRQAREEDIGAVVAEINKQGKSLYGQCFVLKFDPTIVAKDVTRRFFISSPGLPRRHRNGGKTGHEGTISAP